MPLNSPFTVKPGVKPPEKLLRADTEASRDRTSRYYVMGRWAAFRGETRDSNPNRYRERNPTHPDIYESQWDYGYDEAPETGPDLNELPALLAKRLEQLASMLETGQEFNPVVAERLIKAAAAFVQLDPEEAKRHLLLEKGETP